MAAQLAHDLVGACEGLTCRPELPAAVVLRSGGPAFWLLSARSAEECDALAPAWGAATEAVGAIEAPTIAVVAADAIGPAWELALACDLRLAATHVRIGCPEVRWGRIPAAGGTQRLTRLCGESAAKRLILGAESVDGTEAWRLGVVQWVQPRAQLADWSRELAARIAAMPKAALIASKHCIAAGVDPRRDGFAEEIAATRALYDHPETRQKVSEFLGKSATRNGTKEMR